MEHEMEREFCSNFKCCHVKLSNLHALFDHFESCHPGNDISDLSFSVPGLGPSSTSEVLLIPAPPSSPRKLKSLFTRVPLPPIPPISPIESNSSCTSPLSPPEPSSASSQYSQRSLPVSRTPSFEPHPEISVPSSVPPIQTRDKVYTPIAVPLTPRQDPSSWRVSAPVAFYPEAMGYGYGYWYYPIAPPIPHAPVSGATPDVEVIDVDLILSPHASPPPRAASSLDASAEARAPFLPPPTLASAPSPRFPTLSTAALSSAPSPASPASFSPRPLQSSASISGPQADAAAANPDPEPALSPQPPFPPKRQRDAQALTSAEAAATSALITLRNGFFGSPVSTIYNDAAPAPSTENPSLDSGGAPSEVERTQTPAEDVMQVDGVVDTGLGGAGEKDDTLGNLDVASHTEDAMVDVENLGSEQIDDVRDLEDDSDAEGDAAAESDARPSSPIPAKPPTYLNGRIQYVCPVPLCVKAYQTLNGFRYHERQGTCVTKDGEPCTPVSRGATVPKALVAVRTKADNESFLPRRPPARHSARLSALSTAEEIPAATGPTTRGSVKARSKAKAKSKAKPKLKSTAKSSATARAASPSPSRFSSPLSSYYAPDLDSDADADDVAGD